MSISMGQDSNPPVPATPPCPAASPSCAQHAGPGPAVYRAPPRPATPGCLAAYSHSRRPEAGLGRLPQRDHWGVPRAGEGPSGVALVGSYGGRRAPHRLRATLSYSPTPGRAMGERASRGRLAQQWGCPPKPFQDKYGRESRGTKKDWPQKKGKCHPQLCSLPPPPKGWARRIPHQSGCHSTWVGRFPPSSPSAGPLRPPPSGGGSPNASRQYTSRWAAW